MLRSILPIVIVLMACLWPEWSWSQGCAMCKAVVESGEPAAFGGSQAIGAGLNKGILYLMAVPYVLLFLLFRKRIVSFVREMNNAQG